MLFSKRNNALSYAGKLNYKAGRKEWKVIRDAHDGGICWLVCKV